MSNLSNVSRIVVTPELYEQYAEKCQLPERKVTLNCLLLQLGYNPQSVSVWINSEIVGGFESIRIRESQELTIVPIVAGG